jgi:DNA-binding NarL/FixJ family response regulator
MDIQMPELDGLGACKLLKIKYPGTRVILYSMHPRETFGREALERADEFVPKDRLFEKLTAIIGH